MKKIKLWIERIPILDDYPFDLKTFSGDNPFKNSKERHLDNDQTISKFSQKKDK
jgi:hypothetical protein